MKLNLGAGEKPILGLGFTNVDIRPLPGIDVVTDITKLPFEDQSVSMIYACHVLEHFSWREIPDVLKEWVRVLKHDGILRIAVPDFESCIKYYLENNKNLESIRGLLIGGHKNPYDKHGTVFDERSLSSYMYDAGLEGVSRYDWGTTEHASFDDYSQAYIPHLHKATGQLMSLNMEGRRYVN